MLWLQKTFDLKTIIYLKVLNKNKTNKNRNLKHPVLAKIRHQNGILGENTENGKNRTLRLWHVRRSRAVLGLSVAVSGWSTAQPGVRRSGERASE